VRGARRRPVRRAGLRRGVVTNQIETFTETGILLKSGRELYADIIVTAKALDMLSRLGGSEYQRVMATAVRRFFPWANKR
jgi:cation diffusion facilitator CzcD-associated flavoprotein CzcO